MFPAKQPSKVVVRTTDGKEYSKYLEYPKGDPREPMTMDDLTAKFNALSEGLLAPERQKEVHDIIFACEDLDTADFMSKMMI